MTRTCSSRSSIALLGLLPLMASAVSLENLGRIDFPTSGAPAAQEAFLRGVLLLHSFEYEDARAAFQEAQAADPAFAMAYWGEAMTHNHPLWRQQDRDAALAALAKLAPSGEQRPTTAPTERERAYLLAVEILYGDGDKAERDRAYEMAMRELSERYPDDLEAKAFHALAVLGTTEGVRDFRTFMRAAAIAEEIYAVNPEHPGALHYLIHSYDDPVHAPLGLRAARVYAEVAPAASHAQHMISHIFVALGQWEESVDSNRKAVEVSRRRRESKGLGVDALNYHAFHWLEYSYLQLGRLDEAQSLYEQMVRHAAESGSRRARWHQSAMRANLVVETRGRRVPPALDTSDLSLAGAAQDLFATGYAALQADDLATARRVSQELRARLTAESDQATPEHHGGGAEIELAGARVLEHSLAGALAFAQGRTQEGLEALQAATDIEAALPLEYGPPSIVKPSHELFGEILLGLGKPIEARRQFELALERAPRRTLSLSGLATVARQTGDWRTATSACEELARILAGADEGIEVPPSCDTSSLPAATH